MRHIFFNNYLLFLADGDIVNTTSFGLVPATVELIVTVTAQLVPSPEIDLNVATKSVGLVIVTWPCEGFAASLTVPLATIPVVADVIASILACAAWAALMPKLLLTKPLIALYQSLFCNLMLQRYHTFLGMFLSHLKDLVFHS